MSEFDWKAAVRSVAPVLGAALGGPLAGAAIKVLGDTLLGDPDATEGDVAAAVVAGLSGAQIVEMRAAEQAFKLEMRRIDQANDAAYLADVQNARARQIATGDRMPQTILWIMVALYVGQTFLLYYGPQPADELTKTLLVKAYTIVEVGLTGAIAYFIGSSNGSKRSGDAIRAIAEKQT